MPVSTVRKRDTIEKHRQHESDTGSPEVQVALLSERIAHLTEHLKTRGYTLFDVQWTNEHTRSLGAIDVPRAEYLDRLDAAVQQPVSFQ